MGFAGLSKILRVAPDSLDRYNFDHIIRSGYQEKEYLDHIGSLDLLTPYFASTVLFSIRSLGAPGALFPKRNNPEPSR